MARSIGRLIVNGSNGVLCVRAPHGIIFRISKEIGMKHLFVRQLSPNRQCYFEGTLYRVLKHGSRFDGQKGEVTQLKGENGELLEMDYRYKVIPLYYSKDGKQYVTKCGPLSSRGTRFIYGFRLLVDTRLRKFSMR